MRMNVFVPRVAPHNKAHKDNHHWWYTNDNLRDHYPDNEYTIQLIRHVQDALVNREIAPGDYISWMDEDAEINEPFWNHYKNLLRVKSERIGESVFMMTVPESVFEKSEDAYEDEEFE